MSKLPWTVARRIPAAQLTMLRRLVDQGEPIEGQEVISLLDEIERLYAEAAGEIQVEAPQLPRIDEFPPIATDPMPLISGHILILAKMLHPNDPRNAWIGAKAKTVHVMIGASEAGIREALDRAVGP